MAFADSISQDQNLQDQNLQNQNLQGQVALITGGGSGIGAAIAHKLANRGATIAICGRREHILTEKAALWREQGHQVLVLPGDVSTDAGPIIKQVIDKFERLDILVNNAAVTAGLGIEEMAFDVWQHVLSVNLGATFNLVSQALPYLIASKGKIVQISSISARSGSYDDVAYVASKAGLEGLTRKLALELAPHGIRCNVIRPGLIMTEGFAEMPDDFFDSQVPLIPLGRIGQPEDVANAAAFLCSDEAQFITGTVLTVDGGESV